MGFFKIINYIYLFILLFFLLFIFLLLYLFLYFDIYFNVYVCIHLFMYLFIYLFPHLFLCFLRHVRRQWIYANWWENLLYSKVHLVTSIWWLSFPSAVWV